MCGRFARYSPAEELAAAAEAKLVAVPPPPSWNVAPGQGVLAVRSGAGGREAVMLRWGLIPHWAKDRRIGERMINARAETAAEKPAFRSALRHRRCLVLADGFYEWQRQGRVRQPYYIRRPQGPMAFAGLWERWEQDGDYVESCTVLTTAANSSIAPLHERMPVLLGPEHYALWLAPEVQTPEPLQPLLQPWPEPLVIHPVSRAVNRPDHDGPELIEPEPTTSPQQGLDL